MKTKKHTIQISLGLMSLNLIILTILQFHLYPFSFKSQMHELLQVNVSDLREYFIIICGGIFTSTFVVLFIAVGEYQDEKRKSLENYYAVASEFLQNFSKIKYFELKYPKELVQGCFWEESENKRKKK